MQHLITFLVFVCAFAAADLFQGLPERDKDWQSFKAKHGRVYKNSTHETTRRKNWEANRDEIDAHNREAAAGKHTYTMKENHMSDLTLTEKQARLGLALKSDSGARIPDANLLSELERVSVPTSVDLRSCPCMTPIQVQGVCASSWAFAATAATEFRACRKAGGLKAVKLSEQQLVDCSGSINSCKGGSVLAGWKYVQLGKGQTFSSSYEYVSGSDGIKQFCEYIPSSTDVKIKSYYNGYLPKSNLTAVQAILANEGTVAAHLHAVSSFFGYGSGVYSDKTCAADGVTANLAVALVGYGNLNGVPYWIIRNAWSTTWGIKGYAMIKRGVNMCNIESFITYSQV